MPVFENPEDKEGVITYVGPVLVSNRLLIGASTGDIYAISPYTGNILGTIDVGSPILSRPSSQENRILPD